MTIGRGAVLGTAQSLLPGSEISLGCEDEQDAQTSGAVRRIALAQRDATDSARDNLQPINTGLVQIVKDKSDELPSHMKPLFDNCSLGKDNDKKQAIQNLLNDFQDVFSKADDNLGCMHIVEHRMDTESNKLIKQPPRRVPIALAYEEKEAVDQLLRQNIIERFSSPWASPIVLVHKKSGKIRPCVDYRKLNTVTYKDAYTLHRIQDCLNAMAGEKPSQRLT